MDVAAFRKAYGPWLDSVRPLMEAKDWKGAFPTFPFPSPTTSPWTPLSKPLAECKLALFSTAGVYLHDSQEPFDAENYEGDWSFREVPTDVRPEQIAFAHTHYDQTNAKEDLNCVVPLEPLRGLVAEGVIGGLISPFFSISGYCTRPDMVAEETGPRIAERLRELGADVFLNISV